MSDEQDKDKKLAKELVRINQEDRRQVQYMYMKEWDAGIITGLVAIESIIGAEKVIHLDMNTLRKARGTLPTPKGK